MNNRFNLIIAGLSGLAVSCGVLSFWLLSGIYKGEDKPRIVMNVDSAYVRLNSKTISYKITTRILKTGKIETEEYQIQDGDTAPNIGERLVKYNGDLNRVYAISSGLILAIVSIFLALTVIKNVFFYPYPFIYYD